MECKNHIAKIQHESTQVHKTNAVNSAALPDFESHCGCRAKPSFVQPPRGHLQSDVIVRTFKTCTTRGGGSKLRSGRQFSSRPIYKNRSLLLRIGQIKQSCSWNRFVAKITMCEQTATGLTALGSMSQKPG